MISCRRSVVRSSRRRLEPATGPAGRRPTQLASRLTNPVRPSRLADLWDGRMCDNQLFAYLKMSERRPSHFGGCLLTFGIIGENVASSVRKTHVTYGTGQHSVHILAIVRVDVGADGNGQAAHRCSVVMN